LTVIVILMAAAMLPAEATTKYNILSLDGAGEGGILTADMVSYMEKRAYRIAELH